MVAPLQLATLSRDLSLLPLGTHEDLPEIAIAILPVKRLSDMSIGKIVSSACFRTLSVSW
jgi:hypothetical protein